MVGDAQAGRRIVFESSVTAPLRVSSEPSRVAPVFIVLSESVRIVPRKTELTPSVVELVTCQKTLQAVAPLIRLTVVPGCVMRLEPAWNTKTALGSPPASRVRGTGPLISRPDAVV